MTLLASSRYDVHAAITNRLIPATKAGAGQVQVP